MGGYIGATAVGLTTTAADVQGDITSTDTTPELILKNTSEEDTEGGREGKITFKGEQSGGEETTLAQIESAHDGTADDEKGDLVFKTNDGNDGASPTERLRLDSAGDMLLSSPDPSFTITNTTHEDTDGGRESTIVFKGEQSGGELSTLAEIEASHDGTADDEKGDLIFRTNDGSDGASPTERVRIDSNGSILTATLGTDNVHLGEGAAASIASGGNQNTLIGKDAGTALTTGDSNTFIGAKVGDAITTASGNVAIGGDATYAALGSDTQGKFTTAIGVGALRAQNFTSDTQTNNTAIGYFAGGVMTTGTANTFVGSLAGDDCVDGIQNVAVGYNALSADAGNNNTAVGESALTSTTGVNNTAIGNGAGNAITTGTKNSILGMYNGNQNNLDIRTNSNHIVLSDGDGQPRMFYESNQWFAGNLTAGSYWPAVSSASGKSAIMLGTTSGALAVTTHDAVYFNKNNGDGTIVLFYSDGNVEGTISISGSTTSFNGGHLSRWSQLSDGSRDNTLVKGTVMTNLDQMAVWEHDAVAEGDTIKNAMGETVTATADDVADAYTENNEQLNCMAVSSVEGDPNVAGVFVDWDDQDDGYNDLRIAMTGDMVIRIAQGTTVARGDLLMSAGDGTAKPQDDDIVRSKTIAKVTSTNVSHTYDDGSYLVPCVLMAC